MSGAEQEPRELAVHMGAYAWIQRAAPRGAGRLGEADKPTLMHLWSFADFRSRCDAHVRPSRARLCADLGCSLGALKKRLARLAASGWRRRTGRGWDLAWREPFTLRPQSEPAPTGADQPAHVGEEPAPIGAEVVPLRPRSGPEVGPDRGRHDQTIEQKGIDQNQDHDHVPSATLAPTSEGRESTRSRPSRPRVSQQQLFDGQPEVTAAPVRDAAQEVFDHLRARVIATKRDMGIKPAVGPSVLSPTQRRNIEARIAEQQKIAGRGDGIEAGVEACKRVIDVDEADCRRQGPYGKGWNYWNADTPFRNAANFDARLLRWREDGNHAVFGFPTERKPRRDGTRRDHGFDAAHPEQDEVADDGTIIPGTASMMRKLMGESP